MPNRVIRESIRTSHTVDRLSAEVERLFVRLITVADDTGRFDADPRVLLAQCLPLKVDRIKPRTVEKWRDALATSGIILLYEVTGRSYGYFVNWPKYQRQYNLKPKFPEPPAICGESPPPAKTPRSYPRSESDKRETKARTEGKVKGGEAVRGDGNGKATEMNLDGKSRIAAAHAKRVAAQGR